MPDALRLILCADDGADRTLIKRLFRDAGSAEEDRPQDCEAEGGYRPFSTGSRQLLVAAVAGHKTSIARFVADFSPPDLAVMQVDARKGIAPQIKQHSRMAAMLGIRYVVLAVDGMDTIEWERDRFEAIAAEFRLLELDGVQAIPVCASSGENLARPSAAASWYRGPTLLEYLETVDTCCVGRRGPFYMPVQSVNGHDLEARFYFGRIAQGSVSIGDRVGIAPSGSEAEIAAITDWQGARATAACGDAVTLGLSATVHAGPGDVIAAAHYPVEVSDQFQARLIWIGDEELVAGRAYLMRIHSREAGAMVTRIKHRLEIDDGSLQPAATLALGNVGIVNIATDHPVPFAPHNQCRTLGGFTLIDRQRDAALGLGMIDFSLRRATNIRWQQIEVSRAERARLKLQSPRCLWLTGLSGAGKSTIANLLEKRLHAEGRHTYLLDGDNVRHGLNHDLGFTEADRVENIRRVSEVARLMVDAGLIVIVAFISPFRTERNFARSLFAAGEFKEIFVHASLTTCEARDTKGLYAKARRGDLNNFTGIDSPYEPPPQPDLRLDTESMSPSECVEHILSMLQIDLSDS